MRLTLPQWTRNLPNDARLTAKDLASFMECTPNNVSKLVREGKFPDADSAHHKTGARAKKLWSMGLLRRFESE